MEKGHPGVLSADLTSSGLLFFKLAAGIFADLLPSKLVVLNDKAKILNGRKSCKTR
jgi:hypothetical protein